MADTATPVPNRPELIGGAAFYFSGEDRLRLTVWNSLTSVAVSLSGRFLHCSGQLEAFVETLTPATNRTASTKDFPRAEGWLCDLSLVVTGAAPVRGQVFARVDVIRGENSSAIVLSTLAQGYLTATKRLAYPGSVVEDSLSGAGVLRSILGTDPAANVEISETVPTGARWRLQSLQASLVTDATAANRVPALYIDDGTNEVFRVSYPINQTASLTWVNTWIGVGGPQSGAGIGVMHAMPNNITLLAGYRLRTVTVALQATDNWGAPRLGVEEWLEAV